MEQDLLVALALLLLPDVLERVPQRLDRRLDRRLDVPAFQLHAVDFALHVFEARLRLVEEQVRAALRFADDAARFLLGVRLDVVGESLGREQRGLQVLFVLAVLFEDAFHAREFLAQAVGFAQRLLVVVGDGHEERRDLDFVEAPEGVAEALLAQIERADIHGCPFGGAFPNVFIGGRVLILQCRIEHI